MCFDHLADVHSRVAADWLRGCESVWPDDGCYHSFVINLTDRWSVNKVNEPVLVHGDTCRATGHTHSHFSPSISVLMCFIGATNNVTFALVMQSQLNVQWRKTSFTVSASIFLCVQSFCSHQPKYMQIILYMQIYAKWHQICKIILYFFSLFIQFLSFICLVLFECLQITLSCARQLSFTFKSSDAQTYLVTV